MNLKLSNHDGVLHVKFDVDSIEDYEYYINLPFHFYEECSNVENVFRLVICGSGALDFIFYITHDIHDAYDSSIIENFIKEQPEINSFKFELTKLNARAPSKSKYSDSGYDVTLTDIIKTNDHVTFYGTGLKVQPPTGFYFDMVSKSSITKLGYMLASNVGIIDQSYTGEIMVPLIKIDKNAPDLELPCKLVQLIPRRWYHFIPKQIGGTSCCV
jgi:dUTP pyrophosphatase